MSGKSRGASFVIALRDTIVVVGSVFVVYMYGYIASIRLFGVYFIG